jgi:trans-aconitate 2-methyltransferase
VNKYYLLAFICGFIPMYGMEMVKQDWNAGQYKHNSTLQYQAAMAMLSNIKFRGNETILDIGCGDGRITEEIAKRIPKGSVIGIDISPNMIEHARKNHKQNNLTFELYDISKIETVSDLMKQFKSGKRFNFIMAFSSLSWVEDQGQVFKNVFYLLKREGELRASLAHEDSPYLQARLAMQDHSEWKKYFVDYKVPFYPSNEEKIKRLLKDAFLLPIEVEKKGVPRNITREDFISCMRAIPAQIDRIPEGRRTEFLNDIVDEYLKKVPQKEDGFIEVTFGALVVRACAWEWPF